MSLQFSAINMVLGLLVALASSGLNVGGSLAKVDGQRHRFQVSFLPIGASEAILAAKTKKSNREREINLNKQREREKERKKERQSGDATALD